jgi:hypothetical protein
VAVVKRVISEKGHLKIRHESVPDAHKAFAEQLKQYILTHRETSPAPRSKFMEDINEFFSLFNGIGLEHFCQGCCDSRERTISKMMNAVREIFIARMLVFPEIEKWLERCLCLK